MAQNHQIKMSLMFDANTSKAKASLKDLQTSLNNLTNGIAEGDFPMTGQIKEAYMAAEKLKTMLNSAVDMSTGKFDITKFNAQLKQSGLSAAELGQKFAGAGAAGAQAFASLASAIANAEMPMKRVSALVDNMAKSLKQTLQWQISSSVIHGFTGALSSAYGYAQDLNRSLNDIRIVTGQNADFMERYAASANKAAKALSATTNEYAKASLIFYQQGLDDKAVAERTAAAIKMANVTGETASDISSYMTAIWNNFDDGTKSLEYYADAITALGAATASSTEEIAGGMQQFASVAETVGLSYEYAASALATVVSATRQSEETVGTSFKTIFARLSSLQLGETLDDGTNLTKYSQALANVGINIKDSQGELKSMDQILDELGAKWNNISREQQNALAYTVAGTRQYNNFISLLDNYKEFKVNVDMAIDSEGTLNKQQEIYAESWEAAADRARAAAETIYEKLLDDDFFIDMLNGLEKFLSGFDKFIDSIGGLPGVLSLVSTLMLRIFSVQAQETVRNMTLTLKDFVGMGAKEAGKTKTDFLEEAKKTIANSRADVGKNTALDAELSGLEYKIALESQYLATQDKLTKAQREEYQVQMSLLDVLRQQNKEKAAQVDKAREQMEQAAMDAFSSYSMTAPENYAGGRKQLEAQAQAITDRDHAEEKIAQTDMLEEEERLALHKAKLERQRAQAEFKKQYDDAAHKSYSEEDKRYHSSDADTEAQFVNSQDVLALMDAEIAEREARIAALQESRKAYQAEANAATMRMSQLDESQNPISAKIELDKYLNYSSGQADLQQNQLLSLIESYRDVNVTDMKPEEYEKAIGKLKEQLDLFVAEYGQELDESTTDVVETILNELMKGKDEGRMSADELVETAEKAHAAGSAKYRKKDAEEIRVAMREETGAEFSDAAIVKLDGSLKNMRKASDEAKKSMAALGKQANGAMGQVEDAVNQIDGAQAFVNLTTAVSSLTTVFTSLTNIIDVWNNSDMSFSEKLLQTFSALPGIIGSVTLAFSTLQKMQIKDSLATIANTIAKKANTAAERENAKASKQAGNAKGEQTTKINKNTMAETLNGVKGKFKNLGSSVKTGFKDFGSGFKAGMKGAATTGASGAAGGTASVASSLGTIASAALPIAGGIALIAGAIALSVHLYNKEAKAAEKAAKASAQFAEDAKAAKEKYDDTVSTVTSYNEIVDNMKTLTRGTQEWNEALLESNEQAFELINKFDTLAGKYHMDENGQIVFDQGALDEIQREQLQATQQAQANTLMASNVAKKAENDSMETDLARKLHSDKDKWKDLGNAAAAAGVGLGAGALIGAGATSWSGPGAAIGAAIGAATGLIAGGVAAAMDLTSTEAERDALEKLVNVYETRRDEFSNDEAFRRLLTEELKIDDESLVNSLVQNRDAVKTSVSEMASNTAAVKAQTELLAAQNNKDNNNYQNSRYKDLLNKTAAKNSTDTESQAYKDAVAKVDELFKGNNLKDNGVWDQYFKLRYGDEANNYDAKTGKWFDNSVTVRKEENGVWSDVGVTDEESMKAWLIEYYATQLSDEQISAVTAASEVALQQWRKAGINDEQLLTQLATQYGDTGVLDLSHYTGEQLKELAANTHQITDKSIRDATNSAILSAQTSWNALLGDFSTYTKSAIQQIEQEAMRLGVIFSRENAASYGEFLEKLTVATGDETAAIAFQNKFNQLLQANPDKQADIMTAFNFINWDDPLNGAQTFEKELSKIGLNVDVTGWALTDLGASIDTINFDNQVNQLLTMQNYVKVIKELFDQMKVGNILTQEQFEQMKEAGLLDYNNVADYTLDSGEVGYMITSIPEKKQTATESQLILSEIEAKYDANNKELAEYDRLSKQDWYTKHESLGSEDWQGIEDYYLSFLGEGNEEALAELGGEDWINKYFVNKVNTPHGEYTFSEGVKMRQGGESIINDFVSQNSGPQPLTTIGPNGELPSESIIAKQALIDIATAFTNGQATWADLRNTAYNVLNNENVSDEIKASARELYEGTTLYGIGDEVFTSGGADYGQFVDNILVRQNEGEVTGYIDGLATQNEENKNEKLTLENNMITAATTLEELERIGKKYKLVERDAYKARLKMLQDGVDLAKDALDSTEDINAQLASDQRRLEKLQAHTDALVEKGMGRDQVSQALDIEYNNLSNQKVRVSQKKTDARKEVKTSLHDLKSELKRMGISQEDWDKVSKEYDEYGNITNWESIKAQLYDTNSALALNEDFNTTFTNLVDTYQGNVTDYINAIQEEDDIENQMIEEMVRRGETMRQVYEKAAQAVTEAQEALGNYQAVISTLGADWLGLTSEQQKLLNDTQAKAAAAQVATAKDSYNSELSHLDYLKQQLKNGNLTKDQRDALYVAIAEQEKIVEDSLTNLNNVWNNALTQAAETFQANMDVMLQEFDASIAGVAGSLENMSRNFQQQSELSEQYLADYEKVYELNKLSRNLQNSIDSTKSIAGKQALAELQEEINARQAEGVEVSQYDLEYMKKKYDLRLAEIALEETQNAKSQVRLQKMANGSWGYVYTQNENDLAKAQADYEEKLYNLQDHNTNYLNTVSEQIIKTQQDFTAAVQEIYSSGLSEEEQKKRIEEVTTFYESKLGYLTSEMDAVLANNVGLQGMITEFSDTLLGAMYPEGYDDAEDIFTTWQNEVADPENGLLAELNTLANSYKTNIETVFGALETSIDTWLDTMLNDTRTVAQEMSTIIEKAGLGEAFSENLGATGTRTSTIDTILQGQRKKGISLWDEESLNAMDNTALQRAYNQAAAMGMINKVSKRGWYNDQAGFTRDEMIEMLQAVAPGGYLDIYGDLLKISDDQLKTLMKQAMGFGWLSWDVMERLMQGDWAAFASGGYTGEWGPEGRLAMLHEKELVLNAADTQNLLHIMKIMDRVIQNIDLSASAAASSRIHSPGIASMNSTLEQQVTIHAEFPNATNHSEIEQAFDTLINRATQYSNRR